MAVEAYIEEILAQHLTAQRSRTRRPQTTAEIRAWLDSLAQFSDKIPPLPETISREWIYHDSGNLAAVFDNISKDVRDSD